MDWRVGRCWNPDIDSVDETSGISVEQTHTSLDAAAEIMLHCEAPFIGEWPLQIRIDQ